MTPTERPVTAVLTRRADGRERIAIIETLNPGDNNYRTVMGLLGANPIARQWQLDAESGVEPGVSYAMVYAQPDGRHAAAYEPAAWAGWKIDDTGSNAPIVVCCSNYVRHGFRNATPDLYSLAHAHRHRTVLTKLGLPAIAYLYPEPRPLYYADGWTDDDAPDANGTSQAEPGGEIHHWQRLLWRPPTT